MTTVLSLTGYNPTGMLIRKTVLGTVASKPFLRIKIKITKRTQILKGIETTKVVEPLR